MSVIYSLLKSYVKKTNPKDYLKVSSREELIELMKDLKTKEDEYSFPLKMFKNLSLDQKQIGEDIIYHIKKC